MFLGWGADFEKEFMDEMSYRPTDLANLFVRVNGQFMFKDILLRYFTSASLEDFALTMNSNPGQSLPSPKELESW